MLFNSYEFLFAFLPIVLGGFLLLQRIAHTSLLLFWLTAASLFFYAWWNPIYLLLLAGSAISNYGIAKALSNCGVDKRRVWLCLGITLNLALLGYFKYANFFVSSMNSVLALDFHLEKIVLPLAISFYTFQQITYLVDSSKGLTKPHSFLEYALFVSFFPQLIAGPIVHHSEMLDQFRTLTRPVALSRNLVVGGSILIIGLAKKVLIADSFALIATPVFTMATSGTVIYSPDVWAGVLSYAFQLYFDFSGYSDMAIGLACLFGLRLPVNFYSPYRAQNISDFWRMWHASLSRFLRDYIYTPLGGFLCSPNRQRFNLFATMFAGGIWHGAGWTFIAYGFCHGFYVVVHQLWRIKVSGPRGLVENRSYQLAAQAFTFLVVALTLVLFRADSIESALYMYSQLLSLDSLQLVPDLADQIARTNIFRISSALLPDITPGALVIGLTTAALISCWVLPSTHQLFKSQDVDLASPNVGRPAVWQFQWQNTHYWAWIIGGLALLIFINLSRPSEFLYFQF